ncbi:hypothetical protein HPP92_012384 [Vanilla planifolia]|uniref:Uncharacterized protein n=1 Tax=Vanilla planifolia TaxID=51239 RepID=A0A835V3A5_VANPL|nr:hypothetical protein HPP92_012384 [Vanilla planifolia]
MAFLFLPLTLSLLAAATWAADPLFVSCSGGNYTVPSVYATLHAILIANLIAITPTSRKLYFTNNVGRLEAPVVYGIAQCRVDTSATVCAECLRSAFKSGIEINCQGRKVVSIRNGYCTLRYADYRFFSLVQHHNVFNYLQQEVGATNPGEFWRVVSQMLSGLLLVAARSSRRCAVGSRKIETEPGNLEIYGMAWCLMDLSPEDCLQCFELALKGYELCCGDKMGGAAVNINCIITHDNRPFFNVSRLNPPILPLPPQTSGIDPCLHAVLLELGVEEDIKMNVLVLFSFTTLKAATNNFSYENKLGEGRIGPSYKGALSSGQPILVKRLTKFSEQGLVELRNEAALLAQLQHKNLVNFLGCCLERDEKLLVFEYLPNASLEKYLFDPAGRAQLGWNMRRLIAEGIARGLVYLHVHSRHKIIHRDLNANNVLLDDGMNPKISEFGLAKLLSNSQSQYTTEQIEGTCGYMAPECIARGAFSAKSDVFSYGMLVLQIVTGRRNGSFIEIGRALNLQTYVWQHWNQGKAEDVIDQALRGLYELEEVLRCLIIGLLCVQEDPANRPSMASVVLMLDGDTETLPAPSLPGYFTGASCGHSAKASVNEINFTV